MALRSRLACIGMALAAVAATLAVGAWPAAADTAPAYLTSPWSGLIVSRSVSDNGVPTCTDLSFAQWQALGSPRPRQVAATIGQALGQDEIWWFPSECRLSFGERHLSPQDWGSLGAPTPTVVLDTPDGTHLVRFASNNSELFIGRSVVWNDQTPFRHVTFAEWTAAGSPTPTDMGNQFFKLSWDPAIFTSFGGDAISGYQLSYPAWVQGGAPTPAVLAQRIPGDRFLQTPGSNLVVYRGPGIFWEYISYAQWRAAGFPPPTPCTGIFERC